MGVVSLVTVGVGLLGCACAVFDPHLPTGTVHVTREPEVAWQPSGMTLRSMRNEIINHLNVTKRETWYSGDELRQLMMSNTRSSRVVVSFSIGLQVAMATCAILMRALESRSHPHSGLQQRADRREWRREESPCEVFNAHELEYQSCKISWSS